MSDDELGLSETARNSQWRSTLEESVRGWCCVGVQETKYIEMALKGDLNLGRQDKRLAITEG